MDDSIQIAETLSTAVQKLRFGLPVAHVYNPLNYAWNAHKSYLKTYATGTRKAVFLGMNPGPYGMAQTGVPFGDPTAVRDLLNIRVPIGRPKSEHPKRPIYGMDSPRGEVSGRRVWAWVLNPTPRTVPRPSPHHPGMIRNDQG